MKRALVVLLYLSFASVLFLDLLFPSHHAHFFWHRIPGYEGLLGLGGCAGMIYLTHLLGEKLLHRREGYYD